MSSITQDIYRIINKSNVSTKRGKNNETIIKDSRKFRGLPLDTVKEIADMTDSYMHEKSVTAIPNLKTWSEYVKETRELPLHIVDAFRKNGSLVSLRDSVYNDFTGTGGTKDPGTYNYTDTNIWMSPWEANSLYSQKGLIEQIINKKAKSILLNGLKIKNRFLTPKEIDQVSLNMVKHSLPNYISDASLTSLVYGGSLLFPMLHGDNPVTMELPLSVLLKHGILRKGCLDYIIVLDRWNVTHLPSTNPTQRDYLYPEKYFIPYLGCDVHGSRCARVVTSRQAGFYGNMLTLGWGLPDAIGYAKEVVAYCATAVAVPTMIQQMSVIARTIDVSGALASEGINALDDILKDNSIKELQWSPTNPINLDMIGNLSVINRNFQHVPELIRIERQDLAAKAGIPEPMIFSSEKGNFSSGDDTQGNLAKQYETTKYIHKDLEPQFKQFAKICIIDALGTDDRIIKALPYTEIHFDEPMIANSTERAEIGKNLSDMFFKLVSGQCPQDISMQIVSNFGGEEITVSSDVLEKLDTRQKEADERSKEKHDAEMELLSAQIENAKNGESGTNLPSKPKKGEYSKLEQAQHSGTRLGGDKRNEALLKAQAKSSVKP